MDTLSWDDLRILLAVHREGSLLAAGRALGYSTSTTGRRLDALEAAIGAKLVHRSQSGTELSPTALGLVRLAEDLAHGLDAQRRDAHSLARKVRVSVPDGMSRAMAKALLPLRYQHPRMDLELIGENRNVDLAKREADIGVRLTRSTSGVLVEKPLVTLRFGIYASPDYVRRRLPSRRLSKGDAALHEFVGLDAQWQGLPHEQWMQALGAQRFPFRSSSMNAILEAVHQGVGLTALLEQEARDTDLVRIEVDLAAPAQSFYLAYHRDLRKVPEIRAAVNAIEAYARSLR